MLALLASCSKDYIEEEIVFSSTPIKQEVQEILVTPTQVQSPVLFQSKAPSYSGVNNTVGSIRKQYYYPGNNNFGIYHIDNDVFKTSMASSAYLDFDSNGQIDLFSVLNAINDGRDNGLSWGGSCTTKIRIVKNVFTDNSEEFIYDAPYSFLPSDIHINDFNGDGVDEVILGGNNSHVCASYSGDVYGDHLETHIYYINPDGTYYTDNATVPTSFYDMASGDIDNDGDVDIVYFSQMLFNPSPGDQEGKPWIYLNDGSGNFIEANAYDHFIGLEDVLNNSESNKIHNHSINLFDLNNDNILDLVIGDDPYLESIDTVNSTQEDYDDWLQSFNEVVYGARVYWGLGEGKFDMNNFVSIENNWLEEDNQLIDRRMYIGISFMDYNYDGYFDIIFTGSAHFKGEFIHIVTNNEGNSFSDSTKDLIDTYMTMYDNPWYRTVMIHDIDNDGDYDIIPSESEWGYGNDTWGELFFFENRGGSFNRKQL